MAQSSRSLRKVAACILVLCCLGGGAWYVLSEEGKSPVEEARNLMQNLAGKGQEGAASSPASPEAEKNDASPSAAKEENTPHQVGAALNTGERPAPLDPQAELLARVDRAMDRPGPSAPDGDSATGRVVDQPPQPDAARRDSVVTPRFVNDLAGWLAASYIPSHHEGRSGRSAVTIVQVNARYSNSGTLRSVERDPLKSRASILNYVFTPGMLEVLYRMYAPSFMDEMERAARQSRRNRPLSDAQVADMFSVYADKFRRLAVSLDAASGADLPALSASIRREAEHEARANDSFARAYMALSTARESGNHDEVAIQSRRMAESTRVAGMYADRQERARNDMAYAIRRNADGHALSSSELLFLGEWLSRRKCSVESIRAAADVCRRMAEQMTRRADDILQHRDAAAAQAVQTSDAGKPAPSAENAAPAPAAAEKAASSGPASEGAKPAPAAASPKAPAPENAAASKSGDASAKSASPAASSSTGETGTAKSTAPAEKRLSSGAGTSAKAAYPEVSGSLNREAPLPSAKPAEKTASSPTNGTSDAAAASSVPAQTPAGTGASTETSASPAGAGQNVSPSAAEPAASAATPAQAEKAPASEPAASSSVQASSAVPSTAAAAPAGEKVSTGTPAAASDAASQGTPTSLASPAASSATPAEKTASSPTNGASNAASAENAVPAEAPAPQPAAR